MPPREDFSQIPRAVADLLAQSASELRALLRSSPLGEGPVIILSRAEQIPAAWTAVCAFENLMGRPAMFRSPAVFEHYTVRAAAPRSTVLVLRGAAQSPDTLRALKKARDQGAVLWAFAGSDEKALLKLAHGVLPLPLGEGVAGEVRRIVLEHVAVASFVVHAARMLRPPSEHVRECEEELGDLPEKIEWVFSTLHDAAAGFAEGLRRHPRILACGGGAYHAAALEAAPAFQRKFGIESNAVDAADMTPRRAPFVLEGLAVLLFSGSRCRIKKEIQESASRARIEGAEVFSITDRDDRELVASSAQSILLPPLTELPGALLAITLAAWMGAHHAGAEHGRP